MFCGAKVAEYNTASASVTGINDNTIGTATILDIDFDRDNIKEIIRVEICMDVRISQNGDWTVDVVLRDEAVSEDIFENIIPFKNSVANTGSIGLGVQSTIGVVTKGSNCLSFPVSYTLNSQRATLRAVLSYVTGDAGPASNQITYDERSYVKIWYK